MRFGLSAVSLLKEIWVRVDHSLLGKQIYKNELQFQQVIGRMWIGFWGPVKYSCEKDSKYFSMTKSVKKYLADICTIKSCTVKNLIFSFFSQHGLIAPHTKFRVYQTSSSCFLRITSQIFDKIDQTKYSFKNIDSFASFKKRMSLFRLKLNIKLCFTFVNFWSFYFHCLSHSALVLSHNGSNQAVSACSYQW